MRHINWKTLLTIGLVAGLIQVASGVAMYLGGVYFVPWGIFVAMSVLLLCIVFGTRWYKASVPGGEISYGQALIVGIVISVSTGIVYAVYNIISISFFYPNFLEQMINATLSTVPASQRTPEIIAAMHQTVTMKTIALANLIRLSLLGTVLSIFASFLLKNRQPRMNADMRRSEI